MKTSTSTTEKMLSAIDKELMQLLKMDLKLFKAKQQANPFTKMAA